MKRSLTVVVAIVVFSMLTALSLCGGVWAEGGVEVQPGGTGTGSNGTTPPCNQPYSGIDSASCGSIGGGKNWRVYKISKTINGLNNGAAWKIVEATHEGGRQITGDKGKLEECVSKGAPYIIVQGLNLRSSDQFYVSYMNSAGKGSYYDWNTYFEDSSRAVMKESQLKKANNNNGIAMEHEAAKKYYNKLKKKYNLSRDYNDTGAFCAWDGEEYTLTAYAKDTAGNALNNGKAIDSKTVEEGDPATVNNIAIAGYTFRYWESYNTDASSLTINPMNSNRTVYAVYEKNGFQGKIDAVDANGNVIATTKWNTGSSDVREVITGCGTGCTVNFKHAIRKTAGDGNSAYSIYRGSNTAAIPIGWQVPATYKDAAGNDQVTQVTPSADGNEVFQSGNLTLYVGNYACYVMYFDSGNGTSSATLCVTAAMPSVSNSDISLKVRDQQAASQYQGWVDEIYTRPNHTIEFISDYTPSAQAGANVWVNEIYSGQTYLGANNYPKNYGGWKNGYNIRRSFNGKLNKSGTIGSTTKLEIKTGSPDYNRIVNLSGSYVGTELTETATTNDTYKTVPKGVSFTQSTPDENGYVKSRATIDFTTVSKTVKVWVPYNFTTAIEITTEDTDANGQTKRVYAGEKTKIDFKTTIGSKKNSLTTSDNSAYTTKADNVYQKMIVYNPAKTGGRKGGGIMNGKNTADICSGYFGVGNNETSCGYVKVVTNGNKDYATLTSGEHKYELSFVSPDSVAGSEVCVAMAVFPASSGADSNWNDKNYDSKWRISDSKCFVVAKRPSIQAWGGNVYTAGRLTTGLSEKYHLRDYSTYKVAGQGNDPYVFGSWGELGVISKGGTKGFASGATIGYVSKSGTTLQPNPSGGNTAASAPDPGGSRTADFCKMSVLTFANSGCSGGQTDGTGAIATDAIQLDMDTLGALGTVEGSGNKDLTVNGFNIENGVFETKSGKNIYITGNIEINDVTFENFRQVPKVVIYAKDNIYIDCNVERLDAILVATNVITCNNLDTSKKGLSEQVKAKIDDGANSKQLRINGAIVAKRLYANRTYGAAAGANSIVPAEIVDFDPTLYLWGDLASNEDSDDKQSINGNVEMTYVREVAPRY